MGHLSEAAAMLPYLTAAGHYKYGQESLPLYISEMKELEWTAPPMYESFKQGCFVARRSPGAHNAVSPDIILEQTYNADAKEDSGLEGIAENPNARMKWVLTKPIGAEMSAKLKDMLKLHSTTLLHHHESGSANIVRDLQLVENAQASMQWYPFSTDAESLMNIIDETNAKPSVQKHLTDVNEIL